MNIGIIFSGFLTPVIAIVTTYIAIQQFLMNKKQQEYNSRQDAQKFKLALFDKRYLIFKRVKNLLYEVNAQEHKIEYNKLIDFKLSKGEQRFFFGDDIYKFVDQIDKNILKLKHLENNIQSGKYSNKQIRQEKEDEKKGLLKWFWDKYEDIESIYKDYLSLNEFGHLAPR